MGLEQISEQVIDTDVLVVGGGVAGCCAAARAAENGLKVTLTEKGHTERSGNAGQGIDHYGPFPNDGITWKELIQQVEASQNDINGGGRFANSNVLFQHFKHKLWSMEELEKLGVPVKWHDGDYYWFPRADHPRGARYWLRVHWQDIKPILSKAIKKRGVNVLERTMVIDLLTTEGTVVGATALNVRTGAFIVIKAKAVVMATGMFQRCYENEGIMPWNYNLRYDGCPATLSGDGYALAYRAGAEIVNMDCNGHGYRLRDDLLISGGNLVHNDGLPSNDMTWTGEEIATTNTEKYAELERKGLTPLYRNLAHLPDDYHKRMEIAFVDEKMVDFKFAEERGANPRTHHYELCALKPLTFMAATGIFIDENHRSTMDGLYGIGDCAAPLHDCANAAVSGFLTADYLPDIISKTAEPVIDEAQVENQKKLALAPLKVKKGAEPLEVECSVRYICEHYVSIFKSEGKLREGLRRIGSLRREFLPKMKAGNPHELMRALEARNVLNLAEAHLNACLSRKETRGFFVRLDYPERDPARDDMLTFQRMENGKEVLEIKQVPGLKLEYAKEIE